MTGNSVEATPPSRRVKFYLGEYDSETAVVNGEKKKVCNLNVSSMLFESFDFSRYWASVVSLL